MSQSQNPNKLNSIPDVISQGTPTQHCFLDLAVGCVTSVSQHLLRGKRETLILMKISKILTLFHPKWLHVLYPSQWHQKRADKRHQLSNFTLNRGQTSRLPGWHLPQRLHCLLTVLVLGWLTLEVLNHKLSLNATLTRQADRQCITGYSHNDKVMIRNTTLTPGSFLVYQCPPLSMLHHIFSHTP